jgi:hypothetical protein
LNCIFSLLGLFFGVVLGVVLFWVKHVHVDHFDRFDSSLFKLLVKLLVRLHRAWAINQGLFSTFALTTSLKISEGTDVARRKRKRREVRFNASILVQSYVRAMVARKRNKKWMTFMRRKNRIDGLVWGR